MYERVDSNLADVESEMEEGEANANKPKKVKKVAKKAVKKVGKKVAKSNGTKASESSEGKIKLTDLASEAGITAAAARRKLRDAELSREGRWSWEEGSKGLAAARKALGIDE